MHKYKLFLDFDKEEAWLRGLSTQGWALVGKNGSGSYRFARTDGKEYLYRIDYRTFKSQSDYQDYLALFDDAGWRHVGGTKHSGEQYFVELGGGADHDIFSDGGDRTARYRKRIRLLGAVFLAYLALLFSLIASGSIDVASFFNPATFYYTPGLWERAGASFWFGFLFETPFAIMRGYWWVIIAAILAAYAFYLIANWRLAMRERKTAGS